MRVYVLVETADCMTGASERVISVHASLESANAAEKKEKTSEMCYVEEFEVITE